MRQLKKGLQGLRSSERIRFLKKLFERFEHVQKWFRRIAWYAHLNSWTECLCRKWMWTGFAFVKMVCRYELHGWNRLNWVCNLLDVNGTSYIYERDHLRVNGTTHFWTKPVDYQFTNESPIHIWRSSHTRSTDYTWRTTDSQYQPVNGISTCDRVFHVWTGHVCENGSCTCEGHSTRERDFHVWMERDVYLWTDFRQTS